LPQGAIAPPLLSEDSILVEAGHSGAFVLVSDILWIDADGNYSSIVMANGRAHTHRQSLTEWEQRLPDDDFARIGRGSIVQLKRIAAVTYEGRCAKCTFADSTVSRSFGRTASTRLRSLLRLRTQATRVS
jgi:DNA-binding LytR/AlgR family response regulator